MAKLAFCGLGQMGGPMAKRLLDAGHDLTVWNRSPQKAEPLVVHGAVWASSPAEACSGVEAAITMLATPEALEEVLFGRDGLARGLDPGTTLIEMSTVGPAAIHELAQKIPNLLDAPVLGSRSEAEQGTLHVFVGGPDELYAQYEPLLATLGTVHHVGPLGAGASAKLVANSSLFGALGVLAEALRLADRLGLSREAAFEVLAATPLAAQAERRRAALEANDYPPRFPLSLARKDADLVTEAAPELRLAQAARSWLAEADDASWGERDYAALLAWILDVPDENEDQRDDEDQQ